MKFNIEYESLCHRAYADLTDFYLRDLPVLFPYPRIYPGQSYVSSSSKTLVLTSSRAICVGRYHFSDDYD